jgi:hypothetical protein
VGADEHGLLVTPLQYCISPDRGLFVLYPYAGVNLQEHFKMLRAVRPDMVLMHINRAAVHLLLGLDEVHSKVSTLLVGTCLFTLAGTLCALVVVLDMCASKMRMYVIVDTASLPSCYSAGRITQLQQPEAELPTACMPQETVMHSRN